MPGNQPSPSSRAVGILFASGFLIVLAGLAGLGATAISDATALRPGQGARPALHPARIKDKYGYADSSGRLVISPRFDLADTFSEGLALVREGGRFGYVDGRGILAIPAVFQHALPFHDGFASVRNGEGWSFIDRTGQPAGGPMHTAPLAQSDEISR